MPHLRIRSLSEKAMKDLCRSLPKELAQIIKTTEDNFTVEKIATTYYSNGEALAEDKADPLVEFLWFDRGPEVRAAAAAKVTELVKPHTKSQFIGVVFINLPKEDYFENGVSF